MSNQVELKRCGARKGTPCPCRQEYSGWRRGDPLADVKPATPWTPKRAAR